MIAIYPGSFDPITNGHLDIIKRASKLSEKLYVAVLVNDRKKAFLSVEQKIDLIKCATEDINNVEVIAFDGLLVDLLKDKNANFVIKGLRAITDFEYEFQMAQLNKDMNVKAETLFMMSSPEFTFLSSSAVREIYNFGGDISGYVPKCVEKKINNIKEVEGRRK